jgi:hypothetical protein
MSYRVRYQTLGGHVHAHFWSSEFGPETAHGKNGVLVFRIGEDWERFRDVLADGGVALIDETPTP